MKLQLLFGDLARLEGNDGRSRIFSEHCFYIIDGRQLKGERNLSLAVGNAQCGKICFYVMLYVSEKINGDARSRAAVRIDAGDLCNAIGFTRAAGAEKNCKSCKHEGAEGDDRKSAGFHNTIID